MVMAQRQVELQASSTGTVAYQWYESGGSQCVFGGNFVSSSAGMNYYNLVNAPEAV